MPKIIQTSYFSKKAKKLLKNNLKLVTIVASKIELLGIDPTESSLKSHKVITPKFRECYSSRITGDIRIIWRYNDQKYIEILELLDIGGHDDVY